MYLVALNLGNSGPGTPGPGTPSLGTLGLGTPDQGTPGLGTTQSRYPKAGYPWIGTLAGYPSLGRCMASHDFNWQRHLKMASPPETTQFLGARRLKPIRAQKIFFEA